jgi:hypothetical protein
LKPLKRVRYESLAGKDDAGRELEISAANFENMLRLGGGGGGFVIAGFGGEADATGPQAFAVKGLVPESKAVASLTGKAVVTFPLSRVDVVFDEPRSSMRKTVGEFSIKLKEVSTGKKQILLTFTKTKVHVALREEILGRLDPASVVAEDEDGKVHAGEMGAPQADPGGAMVIMGGPGGEPSKTATFLATFPTLEGKDFKKFRFRFSESVFEKTVSFEIKDIKLP